MIHVRAMKVRRGGKQGFIHQFHGSGFGPATAKEQLRRGVLMATMGSVLVLLGALLTYFLSNGIKASPLVGPVFMAIGALLFILCLRQFCIVWKLKHSPSTVQAENTQVQEEEEMPYGSMLEMDSLDTIKAEKLQSQQDSYMVQVPMQPVGLLFSTPIITPSIIPTCTLPAYAMDLKQPVDSSGQQWLHSSHKRQLFADSGYYRQQTSDTDASIQHPCCTLATPTVTTTDTDSRVRSCCDLTSVSQSSSVEAPNPRPVIRYSQGQLEELDRVTASIAGRSSPTLVRSTPSQKSLGEHSTSPQHSSHRSLSLSIERTDVVETI